MNVIGKKEKWVLLSNEEVSDKCSECDKRQFGINLWHLLRASLFVLFDFSRNPQLLSTFLMSRLLVHLVLALFQPPSYEIKWSAYIPTADKNEKWYLKTVLPLSNQILNFSQQVSALQKRSHRDRQTKRNIRTAKNNRKLQHDPSDITFFCKKCGQEACQAHDIRLVGKSYYLVAAEGFKEKVTTSYIILFLEGGDW